MDDSAKVQLFAETPNPVFMLKDVGTLPSFWICTEISTSCPGVAMVTPAGIVTNAE